MVRIFISVFILFSIANTASTAVVERDSSAPLQTISTADLNTEVLDFLDREIAAHLNDIKSYDPAPPKVLGAGATGEYTWGTFMNAVGAYAELSGKRELGTRSLAHEIGQIGLLEERLGGTRFSQLYGVLALRRLGTDLNTNPVWQQLSEAERARWRKFLDISAFYDAKTQHVINLPENYLGVAARIASISYRLGLLKDRELLDGVVTRAARPFMNGGLYADDAPPTGRFDRYSNEYARFVWNAAEEAGRQDILDAVGPSLKSQMRVWWDLILPDGYGYAWGRSMGAISYEDTMEIVGFLASHPQFRPAPLPQLASAYYQAWRWLRHDYNDKSHMLSVFAFGRGNYSYITPEREWQQTTSFMGKAALAHELFMRAMTDEKVGTFSADIQRSDVARFEFFRPSDQAAGRQAGVWLVRNGPLYFSLPITTGTKPGVADYLPAPYGLRGFANPVEQVYPSMTPFIELEDGRVIAASDGADDIKPDADGHGVRAVWKRWAVIGGKAGDLVDPDITAEVVWHFDGARLTRDETLKSSHPMTLRRWWVAVPTTATRSSIIDGAAGRRSDRLTTVRGDISVAVNSDWPLKISLLATGNSALGRGAREPIPLHLVYETQNLRLDPGKPERWSMTVTVEGMEH